MPDVAKGPLIDCVCVRVLPPSLKNGNDLILENSKKAGKSHLWETPKLGEFLRALLWVGIFNNCESLLAFLNTGSI